MTESSSPSTVSVESTVRRRLDLSAIPSSSDLSITVVFIQIAFFTSFSLYFLMTESSSPSTVSVESTVRRRLDLSAIPSSSDLSIIPRADSFVVSVGALFCLSSRKKK
ncbi:hypothetical protein GEMRC1_003931 [Eukaryota sp. GEM-RC1]